MKPLVPLAMLATAACAHPTPPATPVNGRLPKEVIQQVVRAHFAAFRTCYEYIALDRDPKAGGRLLIYFVIGLDGHVVEASEREGSTFSDKKAAQCVAGEMKRLVFPRPEGGQVRVEYPLVFNPGADPSPTTPRDPGPSVPGTP